MYDSTSSQLFSLQGIFEQSKFCVELELRGPWMALRKLSKEMKGYRLKVIVSSEGKFRNSSLWSPQLHFLGYNHLIIWGSLYDFHKYLLSPHTFYGRSKIPHVIDFDLPRNLLWPTEWKRAWYKSHPGKNWKCSCLLCLVVLHFWSFHKERSLPHGNWSFSLDRRITDMWHQPNPLDSLEKRPCSQLTGQFVGVNYVLFYITGMLQSTVM